MEPVTLAYLLIALGLLLMLAELFLPTGGILFLLAAGAIIVGVALTFTYGDPNTAWITLIAVFIAIPLVGGVGMYLWRYTAIGASILDPPAEDETVAAMPVVQQLEQLRGRFGKTVSPMRPAGVVDFDGRRIDCITEGMMVEADQWVRCIDVRTGKVIVRQAEKPNLQDFENTNFG